jgi:hypothetical protein
MNVILPLIRHERKLEYDKYFCGQYRVEADRTDNV